MPNLLQIQVQTSGQETIDFSRLDVVHLGKGYRRTVLAFEVVVVVVLVVNDAVVEVDDVEKGHVGGLGGWLLA